MNIVDIVLTLLLVYGIIRGFFRGFLAELASLVAFIAGIYGAIYFSHLPGDFLIKLVSWNNQFVKLIAFAITFIIIVFIVSLGAKFLTTLVNFAALGIINKLLGAAFGIIKVAFIISVIIMFFSATNEDVTLIEKETLEGSLIYPPIRALAPAIVPSILKKVRELDFLEEESKVEIQPI